MEHRDGGESSPQESQTSREEAGVLGLSPLEAAGYAQLTALGSGDVDELAARLDVPRPSVARLVAQLEQRGLAARAADEAGRFVAVRPSLGLGALLAQRQSDLHAAEAWAATLETRFNASQAARSSVDVIDVIRGAEAVATRLEQAQLAAQREVLSFVKAPVAVLGSAENTAEDIAVARGVKYRVVLERAMLEQEPRLYDEILRVQGLGEESRLATSLPVKLFIIDRELALVPLGASASGLAGALLVHRSGLLDALIALFESVWSTSAAATPGDLTAVPRGSERPPAADLQILALLAAGLTDDAVAKSLHTSTRSVQRRVRALMDRAHVDTRLGLGVAAAERGWLPRRG